MKPKIIIICTGILSSILIANFFYTFFKKRRQDSINNTKLFHPKNISDITFEEINQKKFQ